MPNANAFNQTASFRVQAVTHVLSTPSLLAQCVAAGILKEDLERIAAAGRRAEAANLAQLGAFSEASTATLDALAQFAEVQRRYKALCAVLDMVEAQLDAAGNKTLARKVKDILASETPVLVTTDDAGKTRSKRSLRNEDVRIEIQRDAGALVALTEVHPLLAARGVTVDQLRNLETSAAELAGKVTARNAKKGASKAVTASEREAITEQKVWWSACYRALASVARTDATLAALLKAAAR